MNTINENVKTLHKYIADVGGEMDVNFDGNEVEIYWENLRVKVEPSEFKSAVDAIKTLIKLEAYFG